MDLLQFLSEKIKVAPNQSERLRYREDMVKAIISSYPPDTKIKTNELATAAGYAPSSSGIHNCIRSLIDNGEITRTGGGIGAPLGYVYTILVPGNTYDEERGVVEEPSEEVEGNEEKAPYEDKDAIVDNEDWLGVRPKTYTFDQLEVLAMHFMFYNPEASVADFIASLKS
jgi:hypothetical protein